MAAGRLLTSGAIRPTRHRMPHPAPSPRWGRTMRSEYACGLPLAPPRLPRPRSSASACFDRPVNGRNGVTGLLPFGLTEHGCPAADARMCLAGAACAAAFECARAAAMSCRAPRPSRCRHHARAAAASSSRRHAQSRTEDDIPQRRLRQVQERKPGELPRRAQQVVPAVPRVLRCRGCEGRHSVQLQGPGQRKLVRPAEGIVSQPVV
jgi:hypothetical protein